MADPSRIRTLVLVSIAGVAIVVTALLWWSGGDMPEAVDVARSVDGDPEDAPDQPDAPDPAEDPGTEAPDAEEPAADVDASGRWVVDTSRPFDREAGSGTFVGYRVDEELANVGFTTAVGRTPDVEGHLEVEGTRITEVRVLARLDALESDRSMRDGRVRSTLGPDATAEFALGDALELDAVPVEGDAVELTASGSLRIRDVSREVSVDLVVEVDGDGVVVTGSTVILLDDFEVQVPSASSVLSASDEATIEWQLFLVRG